MCHEMLLRTWKRFPDQQFSSVKNKAAKTKNPANYVTEGKGRGIPKTLEEVLGIKYQSINTTLKAADIFNVRNLSIAALEEMRRI